MRNATTATTAATTETTPSSSSSSSRYATWLDQRTNHQQSSQSNDHQQPHLIPPEHQYSRNNNMNTDNNDNNGTNSRYIFVPFSLSWRKKNQNHIVEDEVERIGGVRGYGGGGGGDVYSPLHSPLHNGEVEVHVWNAIELNRRQRRMEYYHKKMVRFYNHDGHHPYTIFFVVCFVYWYTYVFDLLTTLLWGCYAIILWYHELFDSKDVNADMSNSPSSNKSTTSNDDSDIEPAPRLYIIVISTLFALWSIRTITAMIGLKSIEISPDHQEVCNDRLHRVNRNFRNSCRRIPCYASCCCPRRWGLYVTSNIISPISILLYLTFLCIITCARYIYFWVPYIYHHQLYIPSFILRNVIYPILDADESSMPPSDRQMNTTYHYYEFVLFTNIMIIIIFLEYIRWKVIASYRIYLIYCDQYYYSSNYYSNDNNNNNDIIDDDNYDDENYNTVNQRLLIEPLIIQQRPCDRNPRGSSEEIRYGIPAWVIEPPTPSPNAPDHALDVDRT